MRTALRNATRTLLVAAAVALSACADGDPLGVSSTGPAHRLLANSSETLSSGINLTPGSYGSWNVAMPSGINIITLSFDGRINWSGTAGNSNVLEIVVNGYTVTGNLQKGSSYTYGNYSLTEPYYDDRGAAWGQANDYWGLFWSPDFVQNNTSTNSYYVSGGNAYTYVFDVSGLVSPGQTNTITITNRGGWVYTATGNTPTVVLRDVVVTAS